MTRPPFEVADIIRAAGSKFIDNNRCWLHGGHLKVLTAIERCRTAALGGHRDRVPTAAINRTSPITRAAIAIARSARPTPATGGLPRAARNCCRLSMRTWSSRCRTCLRRWRITTRSCSMDLLFRASAQTLLEVAAHPKWLGAELGFLSVLHTWGQTLEHHPHVHCVIPAGGLAPDRQRWIHAPKRFFLPVRVLRQSVSRQVHRRIETSLAREGAVLARSTQSTAHKRKRSALSCERCIATSGWCIQSRPSADPQHVLHYLARYTHRVAISNHRIVNFAEDQVSVPLERLRARQSAARDDAQRR